VQRFCSAATSVLGAVKEVLSRKLGHGLSEAKNLSPYSLQDTPTGPAHKVKPAISKAFNRPHLAMKTA
jgi:hypothetical protein